MALIQKLLIPWCYVSSLFCFVFHNDAKILVNSEGSLMKMIEIMATTLLSVARLTVHQLQWTHSCQKSTRPQFAQVGVMPTVRNLCEAAYGEQIQTRQREEILQITRLQCQFLPL